MNTRLLILLVCMGVMSLGAEPTMKEGKVTMPYQQLAQLLDQLREQDQVPEKVKAPVEVIVHSAEYVVDWSESEEGRMRARFVVSNLSEDWQSVSLFESSQSIASVAPEEAKVVSMDGMVRMLVEPAAEVSVELTLLASAEDGDGIRFVAVPAVRSALRVNHTSEESVVVVTGAVREAGNNQDFGLPAGGGEVTVKLRSGERAQAARWQVHEQYLLSEEGANCLHRCQLRLMAVDNGRTSRAELLLPHTAHVRLVKGEGLWGDFRREMTPEGQRIHLRWADDEATEREVSLWYTTPFVSTDVVWSLSDVSVARAQEPLRFFYVLPFEGVELSPVQGVWNEEGRIPSWVTTLSKGADVRALVSRGEEQVQLAVHLRPRMLTSEATVRSAQYHTKIVAEGGVLTEAKLSIEHEALAAYRFSLPGESRLLSCEVNGKPVEPLLEEGDALLPLVAQKDKSSQVLYSYVSREDPLDPVEGKIEFVLPPTNLFVHLLHWEMALPEEYEVSAVEGNLVVEAGKQTQAGVRLRKQIYHGESPQASLYYTRSDLQK